MKRITYNIAYWNDGRLALKSINGYLLEDTGPFHLAVHKNTDCSGYMTWTIDELVTGTVFGYGRTRDVARGYVLARILHNEDYLLEVIEDAVKKIGCANPEYTTRRDELGRNGGHTEPDR